MADDQLLEFTIGDASVFVPAGDVSGLIERMPRAQHGVRDDGSSAVEARRLLERAVAQPLHPALIDGFNAWEVLWAIQCLPDADVSAPLDELRGRLWALTSGRRARADPAHSEGNVVRLR